MVERLQFNHRIRQRAALSEVVFSTDIFLWFLAAFMNEFDPPAEDEPEPIPPTPLTYQDSWSWSENDSDEGHGANHFRITQPANDELSLNLEETEEYTPTGGVQVLRQAAPAEEPMAPAVAISHTSMCWRMAHSPCPRHRPLRLVSKTINGILLRNWKLWIQSNAGKPANSAGAADAESDSNSDDQQHQPGSDSDCWSLALSTGVRESSHNTNSESDD